MAFNKEFLDFLMDSGALKFGDFVTKSGRNTPFFINTGIFSSGPELLRLSEFYADRIHESFGKDFDVLFGPAYKGIPLAVSVCMQLYSKYGTFVRYCSNRKEVKDHGDKGILLGGPIKDGDRVLIIEDVTTAGTSIEETVPIIRAQGEVQIIGLCISVDREERGKGDKSALEEISEKYGFSAVSIIRMREAVSHLSSMEKDVERLISDELLSRIDEYYEKYGVENGRK